MEAGAFARPSFGPDAAAVPGHNPLHDREAHAGSGKLLGPMQPLEHAEQLVDITHVETRAVVTHPVHVLRQTYAPADLDAGIGALAAVLERVAHEVDPDLPQQRAVCLCRRKGMHLDLRTHAARDLLA